MATTDRNAFFGLPECHIAILRDEATLTYDTPVDVGALGGVIEIALDSDSSNDVLYASDRPWIDSEVDNGFTGNMRFAGVWTHPTLRQLFAEITGYEISTTGTLLGSTGKPRKKFALMSGQSGNVVGKRTCYLSTQLTAKPSRNAATKESSGVHQADEFPIAARPVKLASGWEGSFYENVEGDTEYVAFFNAVKTNHVPSSTSTAVAALAALTLGTTALSPVFTPNETAYTATTTASSLPVTAVPLVANSTIVIVNGETTVTNGGSASLSTGENTIKVTVTNGTASRVYTVVVTKAA